MVPAVHATHKLVAVATVAVVAVAALGYMIYTSQAPAANSCPPTGSGAQGAVQAVGHASVSAPRPLGVRGIAIETHRGVAASVPTAGSVVRVVAAENFWGSLVSQLGGTDASVVSIVSDPNADPHEYESNASDAALIANAQLVIVNGVGYDQWALNLIQAAGASGQVVLNVGDLNGVQVGGGIVDGNPHMWYNPVDVNRTVAAMYSDLSGIAPGDASYFASQYATLNSSLGSLYGEAGAIKSQFAGTEVAATEDIFVYLANYTGLDLVSPPEFMQAVAEGSDPPAQSIVAFQCQLESGQVRVLVYNEQTVTPVTTNLKAIAAEHNVSVVGITETIQPPTESFQAWMGAEYIALENALNANVLGR